jgi:phage tail sheath protein FI
MSRPGVEILSRAQPVPRTIPTATGPWFVVGITNKHPTSPGVSLIHSMTEYETVYGTRTTTAIPLYDAVDAFYREGGALLYVSDLQASPTATDWADALDLFTADLGPGQVSAPGSTEPTIPAALLDHAAATNRVALIDGPQTGDAAAMIAAADALTTEDNARYGALFSPGAVIPGVSPGTTRTVPWSAIEAGIIARNDLRFTANEAAAGVNGVSQYALDLTARFTDQEYQDINAAGNNMARVRYGTIETYGYRSLAGAGELPDSDWANFGNCRLNMQIVAQANAVGERYVFSQLDGRWVTINDFGSELAGMLVPFYQSGSLFGATADDAFNVNVGPSVNTPATIANGELHAVLQVRMSPFAELVVIEVVKVSTLEALAVAA